MADKMLNRIAAILAQVEGERAAGNEEAADNMMEKALALSQAHSIDLSLARAHQASKEKTEEPERRTYRVGQERSRGGAAGLGMTPVARNAHMVDLFCAIAEANDLTVLISTDNTTCWGLGFPSDHEVASKMFAVLSVQMVAEADAAIKRGDHKEVRRVQATRRVEIPYDERDWGGWDGRNRYYDDKPEDVPSWIHLSEGESYGFSDREGGHVRTNPHPPPKYREEPVFEADGVTPVMVDKLVVVTKAHDWRLNFYSGFTSRVAQRLREAKRRARKEAGVDDPSTERGLAIVDKSERLKAAEEEDPMYVLANARAEKSGGWKGSSVGNTWDHSAQARGDEAGKRAATGDERVVH